MATIGDPKDGIDVDSSGKATSALPVAHVLVPRPASVTQRPKAKVVPIAGPGSGSRARKRRVTHPPLVNSRLNQLKPGVTLGEVARATDLNVEHVSRIFNKHRKPSIRAAGRIALFLGVTVERLLEALEIT